MPIDIDIQHHLGSFALNVAFTDKGDGVISLFGPSGAGKTSLINMIAGLLVPERGHIMINGVSLFDSRNGRCVPAHRRRIGYVFQDARLFPHLTVAANLDYGARRHGRPIGGAQRRDLIELLGIDHLLKRRTGALSGGERQRVAIGRALLMQPELLLLDEPMAALDAARRHEIMGLLERLRDVANMPMIHVSHAIDEVARLADTVVLMNAGQVAAHGPIGDVMTRLDLFPLTGRFEAGAVLDGLIRHHDGLAQMSEIAFDGGTLLVPAIAAPMGTRIRMRIRARDVMLALDRPSSISANNILPVTITGIRAEDGPHLDIQLQCGRAKLLSRITRLSQERLNIAEGQKIYALVKSVSIDRQSGPRRA